MCPIVRNYNDLVGRLPPRQKEAVQALEPEEKARFGRAKPLTESYDAWLKRQDASTQVQVLGVKRRQLWLDGTIDLADLIDQRLRPLTLAQLQAS